MIEVCQWAFKYDAIFSKEILKNIWALVLSLDHAAICAADMIDNSNHVKMQKNFEDLLCPYTENQWGPK